MSMYCRRIGNLLSAYLDDELTPDETRSVCLHLESCAHCRAEYRALQETKCALTALARRTPREEIERLLQTDVTEVARQVVNYPISPRTFAAALLSLVGIWAVSTRLAHHDDQHGPPLPEGAYYPFLAGRPMRVVGVVINGRSLTLLVAPLAPAPREDFAELPGPAVSLAPPIAAGFTPTAAILPAALPSEQHTMLRPAHYQDAMAQSPSVAPSLLERR